MYRSVDIERRWWRSLRRNNDGRAPSRTAVHYRGGRSIRNRGVDPKRFPHHQPRRFDRVRDGERRSPRCLVAGRCRHSGVEVPPQGRCPAAGRRRQPPRRRRRRAGPRTGAISPPGDRPSRVHVALVGRGARILRVERRCPGVRGRDRLHAPPPDGGTEFSAVVQHGPQPPLRHRRCRTRLLVRRPGDRRERRIPRCLQPTGTARMLHHERRRRPREPRRHHGSLGS